MAVHIPTDVDKQIKKYNYNLVITVNHEIICHLAQKVHMSVLCDNCCSSCCYYYYMYVFLCFLPAASATNTSGAYMNEEAEDVYETIEENDYCIPLKQLSPRNQMHKNVSDFLEEFKVTDLFF